MWYRPCLLLWCVVLGSVSAVCHPSVPALAQAPALTRVERAAATFPAELTQFRSFAQNPVFTAGPAGAWDAKIRERGWILREGDCYHLWYTGYDGTPEGRRMLGYATSPDGLTWQRHPDNPIHREHWVEDMMVLKQGDTYYMFAEGQGDQAQLLTSTDRIHWTRVGQLDVRYKNGTRLTPGPYGTPTVICEAGTWYLFYERGDQHVWLASSKDLRVWTNVQDEPVLSPGPEEYDRLMIAMNQVIKYEGCYYASFHGSGTPEKPRLWAPGVAVSRDLIHWQKWSGNPLRPIAENKSSGVFVHDGRQFRFYTMHDRIDVHLPKPAAR